MLNNNHIDIRNEIDFPVLSKKGGGLIASIGLCVICLLFSFVMLMISTPRAMAADNVVVLKQDVYLSDNVVTVGDVFENAGRHANHVLAPAPDAGDELVLGHNDLKRIVDAFGYTWVNTNTAARVTLKRAAQEVEKSELARLAEQAVLGKLGTSAAGIEISMDTVLPRVIMDGMDKPVLIVDDVKTDPVNETFSVQVSAENAAGDQERIDINGHYYRLIDVPVLAVNLKNGDIIRDGDIKTLTLRQNQINQSIALSNDDLVGMTPRRTLTSDRAIRMSDLERPEVVEKGQMITMILKNGPMTLTAKGKALDSGSMGDVIRVLNASSNRTVEAEVTGPQRASIALEVNRI